MKRSRVYLIPMLGGALVWGCHRPLIGTKLSYDPDVEVLDCWVAPPEREYMREDGEGPFPPAWPAAAVVLRSGVYDDVDATLCLLTSPQLTAQNACSRFLESIRFADACRNADLRGRWAWFNSPHPHFVLVYHCGGTAGLRIDVYSRGVGYDWATGTQSHSFAQSLSCYSKGQPYLGDVDEDGSFELLVQPPRYEPMQGPDDPYTVWDCRDGNFVEVGQVGTAQLESVKGLTPL